MYASTYSVFHVSLFKPGLIFLSTWRISSRNSSHSVLDKAEKQQYILYVHYTRAGMRSTRFTAAETRLSESVRSIVRLPFAMDHFKSLSLRRIFFFFFISNNASFLMVQRCIVHRCRSTRPDSEQSDFVSMSPLL